MITRRAVLLPVIASLSVAACGEEGPTREEFARQADRVCQDVSKATERLGTPENPAELVGFAEGLTRTVDDAVKRINALEVPEGEAGEQAERFQQAIQADADRQIKPALDDLRKAAVARDEQAIIRAGRRIESTETPRSDRLAREIGADACAD